MTVAENKAAAVDFYCTAFAGEPERASSEHLGRVYVQHSPEYEDGSAAFISFIRGIRSQYPDTSLEVKRVIAVGDLVVLHSHLTLTAEEPGMALADFFRFEDGKVVEHWDVVQSVPASSENSNTMF
jgi:predicted SnoaL-like aldol condensation-catalyzing enzyme